MKPLFVLLIGFISGLFAIYLFTKEWDFFLSARLGMSLMLIFTALGHFMFVDGMISLIPNFIPFKKLIVIASGLIEIAFAVLLLIPSLQAYTAVFLILFLVAILPANIKGAMEGIDYQTGTVGGADLAYLWFRIPLQLFFILWVYFSSIWSLR